MTRKILTLCLIHREGKILLGLKKRGFGMGRWNGFGGKLAGGETIEAAARRELKEESGLDSLREEKRGILNFKFENNPEILEVHVFAVNDYSGTPGALNYETRLFCHPSESWDPILINKDRIFIVIGTGCQPPLA